AAENQGTADMDCDGVPTAMDCDDADAMAGAMSADMDCDGVAPADDCDDNDAMLGARAMDNDCDGALNSVDECPNDPALQVSPPPQIRIDFPSAVAATNAPSLDVRGALILGCENTAMSAEVRSGSTVTPLTLGAQDQGVRVWTFEAALAVDTRNTFTVTATDSLSKAGQASFTVEQFSAVAPPTETLGSSQGIVFDSVNNTAYVSDEALPGVYAIDLLTGLTRVFSGGTVGTGPAFDPELEGGIALDAANSRLLVTDNGSNAIVAVDLATGNRSIFSDNSNMGPAVETPFGIVVDGTGNRAFYVDTTQDGVVQVDLTSGDRTLVSSDGTRGTGPDLTSPRDVELDLANARLLVVGTGVDALVAVDLATGDRSILSGGAVGAGAAFNSIRGVTLDAVNNRALVADAGSGSEGIVAVDLTTGDRVELSGQTVGTTVDVGADFDSTRGVVIDAARSRLIAVDDALLALVAIDPGTGNRTFIAPNVPPPPRVGSGPDLASLTGIALDSSTGSLYVADDGIDAILRVDLATGDRTLVANSMSPGTAMVQPRGLGLDAANGRLLVPDNDSSLDAVLGIDISSGMGTIISGDDSPDEMSETFASPRGRVALEPDGMTALVADTSRDSVFRINLTTGERTTLAEAGGAGLEGVQTVVIDAINARALVTVASTGTDTVLDGLLAVDLMSGALTPLATRSTDMPMVGMGVDMTNPRGLDLDGTRAIVFDSDLDAVIAVDLNTLVRTVLSSAMVGDGDLLRVEGNNANALAVDPIARVAYTVSELDRRVNQIDLVSGDQVTISF
ncbi:MAG: hypothetical protein AAFZ18_31575, partial [Myxococcota bacterium]